nr:hypothetical protein T12_13101 [Ipomoea batatas]
MPIQRLISDLLILNKYGVLSSVGWVAAERSQSLDSRSSQDVLVVSRCRQRSNKRSNPEDPVVIPHFAIVEDDGGAKAPGGVDARAGDGDGSQVNHEHRKPYGKRSQNLDMRVAGVPLGVGG